MVEFESGKKCAMAGMSIHSNPFRHKGTAEQYMQWINGYNSAKTQP